MDIFNLLGISKYSNSEIITPQKVADAMVNLLPDEVFTPDTTFLDPACKSGVFLTTLKSRLMNSDKMIEAFPDKKERQQHILEKQLFGIATSQTAWLMCMRTLYGYLPTTTNIVYIPNYLQRMADKTTDYKKLIQEGFKQEMTFDVIISNPPYQMGTGGGASTEDAMPLYNRFIEKTMAMNPYYISMIIPSRWMSGGKAVLNDMRHQIIKEKHLSKVFNYKVSSDVFQNVDIAGGVQYFIMDMHRIFEEVEFHNLEIMNDRLSDNVAFRKLSMYSYNDAYNKLQYMIITDNKSASIISKVMKKCETDNLKRFNTSVLHRTPFGLSSDFEDSVIETPERKIKVICSNGRETFTEPGMIKANLDKVGKYKVCAGKVNPDRGGLNGGNKLNVINKPFIVNPNEVCSMTYLVLSVHDNLQEALYTMQYLKTKFARFLIQTTLSGISMTSRNYMFVPYEDFTHPWTDEELYKKYNLTQEEIDYIESTIKPME